LVVVNQNCSLSQFREANVKNILFDCLNILHHFSQ